MKHISALIIPIILIVLCLAPVGSAEETPYAYAETVKKNVNLRQEASKKSKQLAQLKKGETVGILGEETAGKELWYRVQYKNLTGYIRSDLLKMTAVEPINTGSAQNDGSDGLFGLTIDKLSTRTGPGTDYDEGGTYNVKGQWIKVLSRAYDERNGIWWVKCEIPYHNEIRVLWTGYKRFDPDTLPLEMIPEAGESSISTKEDMMLTPLPPEETGDSSASDTSSGTSSEERNYTPPTKETMQAFKSKLTDLDQLVEPMIGPDGFVKDGQTEELMKTASVYAEKLYAEGAISEYEITDDSLVLREADTGIMHVLYVPRRGYLAGGTEQTVRVYSCEPFRSEFENIATEEEKSTLLTKPDDAARTLAVSFDNLVFTNKYYNLDNENVPFDFFKELRPYNILIWLGHGNYSESTGSCILTGTLMDYSFIIDHLIDFCDGLVAGSAPLGDSGDEHERVLVTSKYIDKYCGDLTGCLIYLNACYSGRTEQLAQAFLNKGAAVYIGNTVTTEAGYGINMQHEIMTALAKINPDTGDYYSVSEAMTLARNKYGQRDDNWSRVIAYGQLDYRLDHVNDAQTDMNKKPTSWQEAYREFLLGKQYKSELVEQTDTTTYRDPFGNEYYDAYGTIQFGLYDMNKDGIPELFCDSGWFDGGLCASYVYTYANGRLICIGAIGNRNFGPEVITEQSYYGVVAGSGNNGCYYTDYYFINGEGKIESTNVLAEEYSEEEIDSGLDGSRRGIEYASDPGIYEAYLRGSAGVYTQSEDTLNETNWEEFIRTADTDWEALKPESSPILEQYYAAQNPDQPEEGIPLPTAAPTEVPGPAKTNQFNVGPNQLAGTWKNVHSYGISKFYESHDGVITFSTDGIFQSSLPFMTATNGEYTLVDEGFTVVSLAGEVLIRCELSGNRLIMREPNGYTWELEKQQDLQENVSENSVENQTIRNEEENVSVQPSSGDKKALYTIQTVIETKEDDYFGTMPYKYKNETTDIFPADFGSNPDYWPTPPARVRDYSYANKVVLIGEVGTTPGEICSFTVKGVTFHVCVPEVPAALRAYADEHGYSIIKAYTEGTPSESNLLIDVALDPYVCFYTKNAKIETYFSAGSDNVKESWRVAILASGTSSTSDTVDLLSSFTFVGKQLQYSGWKYYEESHRLAESTTYGTLTFTYYKDMFEVPDDDTITYTPTSLRMSDEEAAWFVQFMAQRNRHYGEPIANLISDPDFDK